MNYTLRTWETICKIWDADAKVFSDTGCQVSEAITVFISPIKLTDELFERV